MNLSCFRACDIRGRVPDELNENLAHSIANAAANLVGFAPVVPGRDVRLSSPALHDALTTGINAAGRDVIDIGLCGTEEVYFQTSHLGATGGIMVTASHNPMGYNGLKLVREDSRPISGDSGLFATRDNVAQGTIVAAPKRGRITEALSKTPYIQHLLSCLDLAALKPLRIVTNAGNGGAGLVIDQLASHLPFEFIRVQHEPDGRFPNGNPNPLPPENRGATAEAARTSGRLRYRMGHATSIAASSSTLMAILSKVTISPSRCLPSIQATR